MTRKLIPPGVSTYDDVFMAQTQLDVQYVQYSTNHTFRDFVLTQDGEPILRLPVQRFLKDVPIKRLSADMSGCKISIKKKPFPPGVRYPVQQGCEKRQ